MTRQTGTSILLDPATAAVARAGLRDRCRIRRIAKVLPVGFARPVEVSELLPPAADCPELPDEALATYEQALTAFIRGHWDEAIDHLSKLPEDDEATAFLERFIGQRGGAAPADWEGAIRLETK
jgi:hypothetical protein